MNGHVTAEEKWKAVLAHSHYVALHKVVAPCENRGIDSIVSLKRFGSAAWTL